MWFCGALVACFLIKAVFTALVMVLFFETELDCWMEHWNTFWSFICALYLFLWKGQELTLIYSSAWKTFENLCLPIASSETLTKYMNTETNCGIRRIVSMKSSNEQLCQLTHNWTLSVTESVRDRGGGGGVRATEKAWWEAQCVCGWVHVTSSLCNATCEGDSLWENRKWRRLWRCECALSMCVRL